MSHPAQRLDDVVHQRVRLGILAILAEAQRADFTYLRDTLELTDGNLARHLHVLQDAGYVALDKVFEGGRARTWISATRSGLLAFEEEVAALRDLLERVQHLGERSIVD
jgi:DNA-binding MarR family transcriptional regulator